MFGLKNPCAWCPAPDGQAPQEGESHGICDDHKDQVKLDYHTKRFDRVPSYVGQREQFEAYTQERKGRR